MIVVDSSALMAIALVEPQASACAAALDSDDRLLISAATMAETLIVAGRRGVDEHVRYLLHGLGLEVISVTAASAERAAKAYAQWGMGVHPAALNLGDCFAYEVAKHHDCPLLFIGNDFAQTDIVSAL